MTPDTSVYTDLSGFTSLRAQAQKDPNAALDQVASQFESIFTQMMLKSMRDASEPLGSDWAGSSQMESYQQMFDQQLSLDLSQRGGLGLAEIIATQLGGGSHSGRDASANESTAEAISDLSQYQTPSRQAEVSMSVAAPSYTPESNQTLTNEVGVSAESNGINVETNVPINVPINTHTSESTETTDSDDSSWLPETPEEFVNSLWGLAKTAGQMLGLNPKVILAQAALETGWGKFTIKNSDGSNSFNLFGIKGGKQWSGSEASVSTLEYVDGVAERETASFRSYDSLSDAFSDYASFLKESPRYEKALEATDEQGFLVGLQEGGYATDPNYAEKILSILNRAEFQEIDPDLKNSEEMPL